MGSAILSQLRGHPTHGTRDLHTRHLAGIKTCKVSSGWEEGALENSGSAPLEEALKWSEIQPNDAFLPPLARTRRVMSPSRHEEPNRLNKIAHIHKKLKTRGQMALPPRVYVVPIALLCSTISFILGLLANFLDMMNETIIEIHVFVILTSGTYMDVLSFEKAPCKTSRKCKRTDSMHSRPIFDLPKFMRR